MNQATLLYMIEEYRKNNNMLRERVDELEIHIEHLERQIADFEKSEYKPVEMPVCEDPYYLINRLVRFVK